ncbi:hypothetical protein OIU85_019704 [Salix viminalis]|uniref:Uncharacterized protein n=1 Tax=Salix viminalis TaxID=40686 RepID=A0A9Q0UX07_SALVM|nr:hypothetical protein OIU85_019704 [Salix viminalis]
MVALPITPRPRKKRVVKSESLLLSKKVGIFFSSVFSQEETTQGLLEGGGGAGGGKERNTPSTAEDDYLRVSFPFSSFFSKCASLDLFRGKINSGNGWNHKLLGGGGMSDTLTERKDSRSNFAQEFIKGTA